MRKFFLFLLLAAPCLLLAGNSDAEPKTAADARSCRVLIEGIPFQLPASILASLGDHKNYLPQGNGESKIPGWVDFYFRGGKRLRPLLVYLSSLAIGKPSKEVEKLGSIVELIHLGSLALDDIIDEAKERRGRPPLYLVEGLTAGIITGPWLQAYVFEMAETATTSKVRIEMARVLRAMGDGEILQLDLKKRAATGGTYSRSEYEKVALGKTGYLFGLSLAISSLHYGMPPELVADWQKLGQEVGVAYQVKDDFEDAKKEEREINYALLLASEKWGGSPFRKITDDEQKTILAWQKTECAARREAMLLTLASIEKRIAMPHTADQRTAFATLKDVINYVTTP